MRDREQTQLPAGEETQEALRMEGICKVYPNGVIANADVDFSVRRGEIHALSGENGAGKSTLMKMLFGSEQPTRGTIYVGGQKVAIASSAQAIALGIGMVHQHFMLVPSLSVIENMVLGQEPRHGIWLDRKGAERQVCEISERYHFDLPPHALVRDLSVGQKQKVEILKALLHGARILILDEPTAVLTPQETAELFRELKGLRADGYTIIFISHKLAEVRELCDRITIIRHGKTMGVYEMDQISDEDISRLMVGRDVSLTIERAPAQPGEAVLDARGLAWRDAHGKARLDGVSFVARRGEILGVAGVEGNGQSQLVEILSRSLEGWSGQLRVLGQDVSSFSVRQLRELGVSYIPEDRMTTGIAAGLSIVDNVAADKSFEARFSSGPGLLNRMAMRDFGQKMVERYQILCTSPDEAVSSLSGGNIQKVVLARELSSAPELVLADQPTRGVDVGASEFIRRELVALRDAGKCVLLVSSDLGELLGLSDRIIVLCAGRIAAYFANADGLSEEDLGRYMLGIERQSDDEIKEACA